jgi:Ethanolamine utilization protein EutJ (predicted chaperonin)
MNTNNTKPFHERSKDERREQVRPIFEKLAELKLTACEHDEIKELLKMIGTYVKNGDKQTINIPFPEINKRIKGTLEPNTSKDSCIRLTEMQ